jgi:hypothetical protein
MFGGGLGVQSLTRRPISYNHGGISPNSRYILRLLDRMQVYVQDHATLSGNHRRCPTPQRLGTRRA